MLVDGVNDCSTFDFDNLLAFYFAEEAPSSLSLSVNLPPGDYALLVEPLSLIEDLECGVNEGNYTLELIDGPIEGLCPDKSGY